MKGLRIALMAALCAAAPWLAPAHAEDAAAYPARSITLVAPFAAGGDADLSARNLARAAAGPLGQAVVVMNRAGASGSVGTRFVRDAPGDGYTLLLARVGSQAILPALESKPAYRSSDFTWLGLLELNPVVCVVHRDSGIASFADLAASLRAHPGSLNYSSSGPGTLLNFGPQLMLQLLNLPPQAAVDISYKGGSEASLAVISREVQLSCGNLSSELGAIQSGVLRALLTTTPERLAALPDVPTARELGLAPMEQIVGWSALAGPANMNPAAVERWTRLLATLGKDAAWLDANASYGGVPHFLTPAQTERFVAAQFELYKQLGKQLQLHLD